jgi:ABC-type phosphate transport system substrate-binding protein
MKNILKSLILAAAAFIITGCASTGSSSTEQLLSASGFVSRSPENAKQQKLYNDLPAYKVHRGTYNGQVIYAYKNEKTGLAYVGSEAAYQNYQRLAVERRIASDYNNAAEMNRATAYGWYGAYGGYMGRPVVVLHR